MISIYLFEPISRRSKVLFGCSTARFTKGGQYQSVRGEILNFGDELILNILEMQMKIKKKEKILAVKYQ